MKHLPENQLDILKMTFLLVLLRSELCRDYLKNRKLRDNLVDIIKEAGAEGGTSKATGALLCEVANKV